MAGAALAAGSALADNKLSGIMRSPFSTIEKITPYNDVTQPAGNRSERSPARPSHAGVSLRGSISRRAAGARVAGRCSLGHPLKRLAEDAG
jgi:hypothetical protein